MSPFPKDKFVSLTQKEIEAIHDFMHEHCAVKNCGRDFTIKVISGDVGSPIFIKCRICGDRKNITDYNSW